MDLEPSALLYPTVTSDAPFVSHGSGVFLFDREGRQYIDGCSGAMAVSIGHGQESVVEAAAKQMRSVAFAYRSQWRNEPAEVLARTVVRLAGDKAFAFFMNSGSEANEAAYRLALQYWRIKGRPSKRRVISRVPSNHGNTVATLSIGHDVRRDEIGDLVLSQSEGKIPLPYYYRRPDGVDPTSRGRHNADDFERIIAELGPDTIAALFIEPVTGALGGAVVPPEGYLRSIREICDRHDILLVADEVVTGFGRTGAWFAMPSFGVCADITVIGKGIAGGYAPLSGVLLTRELGDTLAIDGRIPIGHTHSGNPVAAAIGIAVLDYMRDHQVVEQVAEKGKRLQTGLQALTRDHAVIGDVRGIGLLWGVEFVADRASRRPDPSPGRLTAAVVRAARDERLIVYPCRGLDPFGEHGGGDAVLFAPPLTITHSEIDMMLERFDSALHRLASESA